MKLLLLQPLVSGVAQGCIYGLVAMGIVLIYQARKTVSLAQGELMVLAPWTALVGTALLGMPYWLAAISAILMVAALGWLMERLVVRPLAPHPGWMITLVTLGAALGVRQLATGLTNGELPSTLLESPYPQVLWALDGQTVFTAHMAAIAATALVCSALYGLFRYSKLGFGLQAALRNRMAAHHMGLPVRQQESVAWVLAAVLAAIAGLLLATWAPVDANMALTGIKALPAAMLAGFMGLRGAMLSGIFLGLFEALANTALPQAWHHSAVFAIALVIWVIQRRRAHEPITPSY